MARLPPRQNQTMLSAIMLHLGILTMVSTLAAVFVLTLMVRPADQAGGPPLQDLAKSVKARLSSGVTSDGTEPSERSEADSPRFLVRFQNNPDAEKALREFRENRGRGQASFRNWAMETESFHSFELVGVTPSGEAILIYTAPMGVSDNAEALRQLTRQLTETSGVLYADPYPFTRQSALSP